MLFVQNGYCFALLVLIIAMADRFLNSIIHPWTDDGLNFQILLFFVGNFINQFLNYILWHYYWFLETDYKRRKGRDAIGFWPD